jgi:hypothetical protein
MLNFVFILSFFPLFDVKLCHVHIVLILFQNHLLNHNSVIIFIAIVNVIYDRV